MLVESAVRRWPRPAFAAAVCLLLAAAAQAGLQSEVAGLIRTADLRGADVGVCILDLNTRETLVDLEADLPMIPASNMKLVTTLAALDILGPDFTFRTELRLARVAQGAAVLLLRGDGDPAFGDPEVLRRHDRDVNWLLDLWTQAALTAARDAGINRLGRLVVDDGAFETQRVHPGWPADQLDRPYCAPVSGLNFHGNCLAVYLQPTTPGQSPQVEISPYIPGIGVTNLAVTGKKDTFSVGRQVGSDDLFVRGTIRNRRFDPVEVTVADPAMLLGQALRHRLEQAGLAVAALERGDADSHENAQVLHVIQSTMPLVLARCNKDSANLYAEALLKRAGQRFTGVPGSWSNGSAAVRAALAQRLGARAAVLNIDDGSGLSRGNRVTARLLVELLSQVHDRRLTPAARVYLESLSVAGEDGTLRRRKRLGGDMPAIIIGKSGYINAVTTLSGYLILPPEETAQDVGDLNLDEGFANPTEAMDGARVVAFSLLFNNYRPPVYHYMVKELQDKILQLVARRLAGPGAPATAATPEVTASPTPFGG